MSKQHKKFERFFLFSEVASCLNYSLAADLLGISKGYLSEQIKALEKELGVQLLVRTTRRVRLTPEGQQVLERLKVMRNQLLDLERSLDNKKTEVEGILRITAPHMFAEVHLTRVFYQFRERYPGISFHLDTSYERHDLSGCPFDIAIRSTSEPPENMVAKRLFSYRHWYCAAPSYIARYGMPTDPEELISHQCLYSPDLDGWQFDGRKYAIQGPCVANEPRIVKLMAIAGEGIMRAPEYAVADDLKEGSLVRLFPTVSTSKQNLFLVYPPTVSLLARIKVFTGFLMNYCQQLKAP